MQYVIEVLDRSGHLSLTWDASIPESVERAQGDYQKLRAAGYEFFRVLDQNEPVDGFVPQDGALVAKIAVQRVRAEDVAPTLKVTPVSPVGAPAKRRGRPSKTRPLATEVAATVEKPVRTVAMRPMRGG